MRVLFIVLISVGMVCVANAKSFRSPAAKLSKRALEKREMSISKPAPTGAFYIISKHGFDSVNPGADASLGKGEKILTKNIAADEGNNDPEEKNKEFGGINLFGCLF